MQKTYLASVRNYYKRKDLGHFKLWTNYCHLFVIFAGCGWIHNGIETHWGLSPWLCVIHTWGITLHVNTQVHGQRNYYVMCRWVLTVCLLSEVTPYLLLYVSSERYVRNKKHHSDPFCAQLDIVWAGRLVPAPYSPRPQAERVWCNKCGGLVPAGGDAIIAKLLAKSQRSNASKHHTCLPPSVVSQQKPSTHRKNLQIPHTNALAQT